MFAPDIYDLAHRVIDLYSVQKHRIVTAKSCTGGLIAAALTQIPGSSRVLERGFVGYSNDAKIEVLGVMPGLLENDGAVSAQTAEAMAQGGLEFSRADVCVSVTGIAGPTGGTLGKPIGTVYVGLANRAGVIFHSKCQFNGDRDNIRLQAVKEALTMLLTQAED